MTLRQSILRSEATKDLWCTCADERPLMAKNPAREGAPYNLAPGSARGIESRNSQAAAEAVAANPEDGCRGRLRGRDDCLDLFPRAPSADGARG